MSRLRLAARAALVLLVAGCTGDAITSTTPPDDAPAFVIADAAHSGAVPGFYFLPPMVPNPSYSGTFDPGLQPRVEICELVGSVCGPVIATFPFGTGSGNTRLSGQHYQANWNTSKSLDASKFYRIRVLVDSLELGFADVDVVNTGGELNDVDTNQYVALKAGQSLAIKFRIETGIPAQVVVTPEVDSIFVGEQTQFTATVTDLHGNPVAATVVWTSSNPAVATVDQNGLATGVSPGTVTITASIGYASDSAQLTVVQPNTPPVANPDTFDAIGNVTVPVAAPGVLANDTDAELNTLSAVPGTFPTTGGGTVTLAADGSFTYLSAAGFTGVDSWSYQATDGTDTSAPATVTMLVPTRVWYVDNSATAPGDGRDASPFTALSSAEAASGPGETIFLLYGNGTSSGYDQGITLQAGQSLTGQGVPSNVTVVLNGQPLVLLAAGSAPTVTNAPSGTTIQLAPNNTVQGLRVESVSGAGIAGTAFGTLAAGSLVIDANGGAALDLSAGALAATVDSLSSTGSTGAGLRLVGVTGTLTAPAGSISGAAGAGVEATGGSVDVAYGGDISASGTRAAAITGRTGGTLTLSGSISDASGGILVQGNSGGTIAFTGPSKSLATGAATAVTLSGNAGTAINFAGGGLAIATTSGDGFSASGGGTVQVTGAGNTAASTAGGTAVSIVNTDIGASGVTFYSVSATGGGTSGIVLASTGSGGFQVTGDGESDPANTTRGRTTARDGGGTIVLGSGGTISGMGGTGVSLSGVASVALRNLTVQGNGGDGIAAANVASLVVDNAFVTGHPTRHGILGTGVSGLSIIHSEVAHNATTAGAVEAADIWNLRFDNLSGTGSVQHSLIHHSQETVFGVVNGSGVLSLTVTNTNITDTGVGAGGANGLQLNANGTASMTVSLQNDSVARTRARGVTASTALASAAAMSLTVNMSEFADNTGVGLELVHGSGGAASFSFTGNDFQRHGLQPINVNRLGSLVFSAFGDLTGTASGNTIGTTGVAGSGTTASGNGIQVQSNGRGGNTRVAILGNTIRRVGQHGISVAAVDAPAPGTNLEARVEGNNVADLAPTALDGINVLPGALSTDVPTVCLDIKLNVSTGVRNGLRVRPSGLPAAAPTIRLEGWDGITPVATYFTLQNTLAGGLGPVSVSAGLGMFVATPACNTP